MRVGIVAEGRGDLGVLTRILKGAIGVEEDDVEFLRPEFDVDETDAHAMRAAQRSNWSLVIEECRERARVRAFFEVPVDEPKLLVVQLDAAECALVGYDVERSPSPEPMRLCDRIERTLCGWMGDEFVDRTCFAIAVEETEAWVLPLYGADADTTLVRDPKRRLDRELNRPNLFSERERQRLFAKGEYERMREVAKGLARRKGLDGCADRNASLRRFVECLDACAAGPGSSERPE